MNNQSHLIDIQNQIDEIQEYIDTELCKKCEEMKLKLISLKHTIMQSEQLHTIKNSSH